jgi:hypothetical protein
VLNGDAVILSRISTSYDIRESRSSVSVSGTASSNDVMAHAHPSISGATLLSKNLLLYRMPQVLDFMNGSGIS